MTNQNRKIYKVVVFSSSMFRTNKGERQTMNIRKAANLSLSYSIK